MPFVVLIASCWVIFLQAHPLLDTLVPPGAALLQPLACPSTLKTLPRGGYLTSLLVSGALRAPGIGWEEMETPSH